MISFFLGQNRCFWPKTKGYIQSMVLIVLCCTRQVKDTVHGIDLPCSLRQVSYQPSEFHSGRLKHISLPQCNNRLARDAFEDALCGVFSE